MNKPRKLNRAPLQEHNRMRMQYVGRLLREYRYETYMSLEEFSDYAKMSRTLCQKIEAGKVVTTHSLLRYLDALHVSPETIFEGVE